MGALSRSRGSRLCRRPLPGALTLEQLNHRPVKRRKVIRFTTRRQIAVSHRFFVHPLSSGIAKVSLKRWPGGNLPALSRSRLEDRPRSVTDRSHRLLRIEKSFNKLNGLRLNAKLIWVYNAPWEEERIEFIGARFFERDIDCDVISPFSKFPPTHFSVFRGDNLRLCPSRVESLARFHKFYLFEAVGN